MSNDNMNRATRHPFGHVPTLVAALGLWWIILQILPVEFLVSLMIASASVLGVFS